MTTKAVKHAWMLASIALLLSVPGVAVMPQAYSANITPGEQVRRFYPDLIADVAEAVAPSVVNIDVEKTQTVTTPSIPALPFNDPLFEQFFGPDSPFGDTSPFRHFQLPPGAQERTLSGNGSGVILNREGYILTNDHVVNGADSITVTLNDGRKFKATRVGEDAWTDLAVLKLENPPADLVPARLGDSDTLRPGEWVLAIGSPLNFEHTVTLGIVSAISRRVPEINTNLEFIQTDAAINPGNSGGPLVNLRGEVVGINTAIWRGQNIGFAIPVATANAIADRLIADGRITRPWIGISMTSLSPELAKSLGVLETAEGVVVARVVPQSPAHKAGFRQGDVIQRIDGRMMADPEAVQKLVRETPLESTLNVQVLRNGHMVALPVTVEQLPTDTNPFKRQRVHIRRFP